MAVLDTFLFGPQISIAIELPLEGLLVKIFRFFDVGGAQLDVGEVVGHGVILQLRA